MRIAALPPFAAPHCPRCDGRPCALCQLPHPRSLALPFTPHPHPLSHPSLQVIARIHTSSVPVRRLIHSLLVRIGRHHPQALMYPLLVACKSQSPSRRAAAMAVVDAVRQHSATLVEQAQLVSQELIRMAILWHEMWHEALEEASR